MKSFFQKVSSLKILKVLSILGVGLAVIWFGMFFGPSGSSVEAKVFERLVSYTRAMPEYLFDDKATSEPRKVVVNGSTTYLTVGKSKDDISRILDFYAGKYQSQPVERINDEIIKKISDKEFKKCVTGINKLLEYMKPHQHFRLERDGCGLWGTIEFNDSNLKLGSKDFVKKYENAIATGEFGKIGTGRIVIVIKDPKNQNVKIINMWTDRDFNLNNFLPDTNGDMGGKDIPDVPRYPGSRRILSIEQENTLSMDSLAAYEGGGGVVGTILFYHSRMKDWKTNPTFEKVMEEQSMKNMMFYTRKGRECTIQIMEDEYTGKIITTITNREMKNS